MTPEIINLLFKTAKEGKVNKLSIKRYTLSQEAIHINEGTLYIKNEKPINLPYGTTIVNLPYREIEYKETPLLIKGQIRDIKTNGFIVTDLCFIKVGRIKANTVLLDEQTKNNQTKIPLDTDYLQQTREFLSRIPIRKVQKDTEAPTIRRSGDTFVANHKGVDYLQMRIEQARPTIEQLKTDFKRMGRLAFDYWKPFDKICLDDNTALRRPLIVVEKGTSKRLTVLLSVFISQEAKTGLKAVYRNTKSNTIGVISMDYVRLATIEDIKGESCL